MNLLVLDMEMRQGTLLTNYSDFDVLNVAWLGDERLIFSLGQQNSLTGAGQFDGGGLFVVSRDGKSGRELAPTVRSAEQFRRQNCGVSSRRRQARNGMD